MSVARAQHGAIRDRAVLAVPRQSVDVGGGHRCRRAFSFQEWNEPVLVFRKSLVS
jgi:hypothetical protein